MNSDQLNDFQKEALRITLEAKKKARIISRFSSLAIFAILVVSGILITFILNSTYLAVNKPSNIIRESQEKFTDIYNRLSAFDSLQSYSTQSRVDSSTITNYLLINSIRADVQMLKNSLTEINSLFESSKSTDINVTLLDNRLTHYNRELDLKNKLLENKIINLENTTYRDIDNIRKYFEEQVAFGKWILVTMLALISATVAILGYVNKVTSNTNVSERHNSQHEDGKEKGSD